MARPDGRTSRENGTVRPGRRGTQDGKGRGHVPGPLVPGAGEVGLCMGLVESVTLAACPRTSCIRASPAGAPLRRIGRWAQPSHSGAAPIPSTGERPGVLGAPAAVRLSPRSSPSSPQSQGAATPPTCFCAATTTGCPEKAWRLRAPRFWTSMAHRSSATPGRQRPGGRRPVRRPTPGAELVQVGG
jgi:hypothetical protein